MALIFQSCKDQNENHLLIEKYVIALDIVPENKSHIVGLVIPSFSCGYCQKKLINWQSEVIDTSQGKFYVITNLKEHISENIIIDSIPHRINQYNPFMNRSYFFQYKDGHISQAHPININNLDSLNYIIHKYW